MDSVLHDKLTELTTKCYILSSSGKYIECIDIMEEIVSLKKYIFGIDHIEFTKSSYKLCEYLNLSAMVYLQKYKFDLTLELLRKAYLVSRNSLQYRSTTYNNLACYYRRIGKIRTALTYLIQALDLYLKIDQPKTLADTHLNLCAVLSQLDRHDDALQHVMLSIILLQDYFLQVLLPKSKEDKDYKEEDIQVVSDYRLAVLAIAYHNLGVYFEHLKRFEYAVKIYKKALKISKDHLRENDQLIINLTKVVNSATEQIYDSKKSYNYSKKERYERYVAENKKGIYKYFARQIDRLKNLPKLRMSKERDSSMREPVGKYRYIPQDPIRHTNNERTFVSNFDRGFATRKNPRYYKSSGFTQHIDDFTSQTDSNLKLKTPISAYSQQIMIP